MKVYLLVLLLGSVFTANGKHLFTQNVWAVLVAGSNGWSNYRHQADVCHAYQTLVKTGIPKDRIITMMYDDIAHNDQNRQKGKIFNAPNGPNVYEGVVIDYKGKDVNVETFRNVLLGNSSALAKTGSGRALLSGETDHVFINFVDHGGSGMLCFPSENLYATDLMKILGEMKNRKKFEILVMYIEACNSGSVFDNIIGEHDNILVSTASAPDESSYAWYCENNLDTCLGDLYSLSWIERMEKLNSSESLFEQFNAVRTAVLQKSHVNLYGDYSVGFYKFGFPSGQQNYNTLSEDINEYEWDEMGVNNRDIPVYLAYQQMDKAKNEEEKIEKKNNLEKIIQNRRFGDKLISNIIHNLTDGNFDLKMDLETKIYPLSESIFDCYKSIVTEFQKSCFEIFKNTYFLQHTFKLANVCVKGLYQQKMIQAIQSVCNGMNGSDMLII